MNNSNIIILILLILNIISLFIGYILGKISSINTINITDRYLSNNQNLKKKEGMSMVDIDETKFILKIITDNLEKKYDKLATSKQSTENITDSINKLKNLKK
jgi:hypothetical protein